MSPDEYAKEERPYKIDVVHYRDIVAFHIHAEGDTYEMMKDGHAAIWVYHDGKQMLHASIAPHSHNGVMSYSFNVCRDYLATSAFQFNFGRHYGSIRLGDWAESEPRFDISLEMEQSTVQQGEAFRGNFQVTSSSRFCLYFPDDCILGYEVVDSIGEVIARPDLPCGQALTTMKFEPSETRSLPVNVPTHVRQEIEGTSSEDGYLPVGVYTLNVFLKGHRDMNLQGSAVITITPRK